MVLGIDVGFSIACLVLIAGDVISGLVKAFSTNSFTSSAMRQGLWHKAGTILLLMLAAGCTIAATEITQFPQEFAAVYVPICSYIALMEIASIVENILVINPELDRFKILALFKQEDEDAKRN